MRDCHRQERNFRTYKKAAQVHNGRMSAVLEQARERKPGVGRPRGHDRAALAAAFLAYIENTAIPIIAEFAYQHGVSKSVLYDWEEFADLLKLCTTKKEAALERAALENRINPSVAIFSLKQLGWSDRTEQTHRGDASAAIIISETAARL
jgi:hypothetical protein